MVVMLSQTESGGWQLVYQVILELWHHLYYLGRKRGEEEGEEEGSHAHMYIHMYVHTGKDHTYF